MRLAGTRRRGNVFEEYAVVRRKITKLKHLNMVKNLAADISPNWVSSTSTLWKLGQNDLNPCDHVTPALQEFHWLPIIAGSVKL